ncbi:unnamed protein product [Acanthoscelides obtectus]|uniref:Uncharacterized protein n=1 Tax=Acanthoscelides obtectus TaxID=200917 RepID=A0A9P0P050_ACAOB|nr:unnamed protein product [Acanthoscelides obtectus]CAK1668975.1 hypothetical protein AOBTE_LOCUS26714 [Acanthoscelides obtectus]
MSRMKSES